MIRIVDEKLYFTPYEGEEYEVGNIADGNIESEYFSLGDLSLPIERFSELQETFVSIYPNGKPVTALEIKRVITEEEKANDFMKVIALSIMNDSELLKIFGIEPNTQTAPTI